MLPKRFRLPQKLIKRVYSKGENFNQAGFYIKYYRSNGVNSRAMIIIPKKVDKRSSKRNLIKRQISEILYRGLTENNIKFDLIIAVRSKKEYKEYEKGIGLWLKKLS